MKLSVIVPTFNCVTWLPHAISSLLEQTRKAEIIIVDDCSIDRTGEYLDWLEKNHPVKVLRNEKNIGRSYSRNRGNGEAQGDILAVLDADDIATPNRTEITIRKFQSGHIDFIYGAATVIDALGRPLNVFTPDVFNRGILETEKFKAIMENGICHSTAAYTREFSQKYPYRGGDISRLGIDDHCQQIEALTSGAKFDFVPQKLSCYRLLNSGVTNTRKPEEVLEAKKAFLESLLTCTGAK